MAFARFDVSSTPRADVILPGLVGLYVADFRFKSGLWVLWAIVRSLHAEMIVASVLYAV